MGGTSMEFTVVSDPVLHDVCHTDSCSNRSEDWKYPEIEVLSLGNEKTNAALVLVSILLPLSFPFACSRFVLARMCRSCPFSVQKQQKIILCQVIVWPLDS